jgi:hypothetical protein
VDNLIFLVRSQLVARLGTAVASWFRIVPSRCEADATPVFALLLESHLPILVRMTQGGSDPLSFSVAAYDTLGRRLDAGRAMGTPQAVDSFAIVVAEAGSGFQQLKEQVDSCAGGAPHQASAVALPEEVWLHDALHHPGALSAIPAGIADCMAERGN